MKSRPGQKERFVEIARVVEADQDEAAFRAKLAAIARQKPIDSADENKEGKNGT